MLTEDKLLRFKHMPESLQQFLVEGLVLTLEVEHGNRLKAGGFRGSGVSLVVHENIVAAVVGIEPRRGSHGWSGRLKDKPELKRRVNIDIVDSLRDSTAPGLPALCPPNCLFSLGSMNG